MRQEEFLPRYVSNEQWLDVAIGRRLAVGKWRVIFTKRLIFRYVRIQIDQMFQVRNTIGQCANSKIFTRERLQHKDFT